MAEDREIEKVKQAIATLLRQKNIPSEETLHNKTKKLAKNRLECLCRELTPEEKQTLLSIIKGGE